MNNQEEVNQDSLEVGQSSIKALRVQARAWLENKVRPILDAMREAIKGDREADLENLLNIFHRGTIHFDEMLFMNLWLAVDHKAVNCLRLILAHKPARINDVLDEDDEYDEMETALIASQYIGNGDTDTCLQMLTLLLDAGADPNIPNCHGWTPLHFAALCREPKSIKILLEHHANPNLQVNDYHYTCSDTLLTPVWESPYSYNEQKCLEIESKILKCIPLFLEYHADVSSFKNYAEELGFSRVMQLLERHDAVLQRREGMEANFMHSGASLPRALNVSRVSIASYLTPRDFTFFSTATNMHIRRDNKRKLEPEADERLELG